MVPKLLAAVQPYTLSGPGLIPASKFQATSFFEKFASQIIGVLTLFGVLYFIIQIIFAGYGFISSSGDEKKMETNRTKLTNSVLGLFIIVIAVALGTLIAKLAGLENPLNISKIFVDMGL